ncbi:hypothetical protein HYH03_005174 [Edaphochlamys debaryana]|uniref:Protein kinase domain-containing protein n=1 Tax=Edaphochlamys debaryana TaxID=47281 RepID=A0A836C1C8_9CHLO|nr:hypothetical protein HYH03_005174 [Edaphochlamys debaryana]|eukprot:KAG2496766.1 hypothetical protein HYH03_005174 [Edaphochlamys debaryana]
MPLRRVPLTLGTLLALGALASRVAALDSVRLGPGATGTDLATAIWRAVEGLGPAVIEIATPSITLDNDSWAGIATPLFLRNRDLVLEGNTGLNMLPLLHLPTPPVVTLLDNASLWIKHLVLQGFRRDSFMRSPGLNILTPSPAGTVGAYLQLYETHAVRPACLPPALLALSVNRIARPTSVPSGPQRFTLNRSQEGCVNDENAHPTQRCWPYVYSLDDAAVQGSDLNAAGNPTPSVYTVWIRNSTTFCTDVMEQSCIDAHGPLGCSLISNHYPSPPPLDPVVAAPTAETADSGGGGGGGGSSTATDDGGGGGGTNLTGVLVGSIVGGLTLLALLVLAAVWVRRRARRRREAAAAAKGGSPGGKTPGAGAADSSGEGGPPSSPCYPRDSAQLACILEVEERPADPSASTPAHAGPGPGSFTDLGPASASASATAAAAAAAAGAAHSEQDPEAGALGMLCGGGASTRYARGSAKGSSRSGGGRDVRDGGELMSTTSPPCDRSLGTTGTDNACLVSASSCAPWTGGPLASSSESAFTRSSSNQRRSQPMQQQQHPQQQQLQQHCSQSVITIRTPLTTPLDLGLKVVSADGTEQTNGSCAPLSDPVGAPGVQSGAAAGGYGRRSSAADAGGAAGASGISSGAASAGLMSTAPGLGPGSRLDPLQGPGSAGSGGALGGRGPVSGAHSGAALGAVPGPAADEGDVVVRLTTTVLGKGASGVVYEGTYGGRRVAVKQLVEDGGEVASRNALEMRGAFQQELEVLARCDHPNIVKVLAASLAGSRPIMVLELMETSLDKLLYCGAASSAGHLLLPLPLVLHVATQVAAGLSYMHPTIIHRDLKPANVLLAGWQQWLAGGPLPVVKLSDFGLSRLRNSVLVTKRPEVGTPAYMAPECFDLSCPPITHRADVYSFGVLLWEMLAGAHPWQDMTPVQVACAVVLAKRRLPLPPPWGEQERWPLRLCELVQQCFDQDPQRRPAAAEIAKALTLALQDLHMRPAMQAPSRVLAG